ncbi:MAG: hypothetical protein LBV60_15145 [Streptomyces sp.]|jgi:hypothetical protein|nr:hypothetical protein [Streptomyces sp.]
MRTVASPVGVYEIVVQARPDKWPVTVPAPGHVAPPDPVQSAVDERA